MSVKTERVEARLSPDERDRIRRAAAYEGQSLSSFIVSAAVDKADAILAAHTVTPVPAGYFDQLLTALDEPERAERGSSGPQTERGGGGASRERALRRRAPQRTS